MGSITKNWPTGTGSITATYTGSGNGTIQISSDPNSLYENRSVEIKIKTTDGSDIERTITVNQAAKVRIDISNAVVTASNQTYNGSAKTPAPTVTLNGGTIPSSGYDVSYSDNTNAGTATITVTGKGEYTGTATGTFTIAKASRTLSFAEAYAVVAPSGNVTNTATPSTGSGDGAITYSINSTTYATINSSTGKVTAKTSEGSAVVTATIAEGTNYLSASASYNLYVFATTHNFAYTGDVQNLTIPPGSYQLQCWGAQGGSNSAASSYGITAQAGGKGGYAEGVLTIAQDTAVKVNVGGQGGSSSGGFNGGGSTQGSSTYNASNEEGVSRMAGGGGASDIRLSDNSLYSRMIVAGGGSGGAMCCKKVTTPEITVTFSNSQIKSYNTGKFIDNSDKKWWTYAPYTAALIDCTAYRGKKFTITKGSQNYKMTFLTQGYTSDGVDASWASGYSQIYTLSSNYTDTVPSNATYLYIAILNNNTDISPTSVMFVSQETSTTTTNLSQVGYVGGGTTGGGYSDDYKGKQNAAGSGGSFGDGSTGTLNTYRYCSAGGGGGWYGGGGGKAYNSDINAIKYSGGGSGFVNTSASAGNRPSGYTGLELDSGSTTAGNSSFPAPGGGNETGHAGNGYARITRLA